MNQFNQSEKIAKPIVGVPTPLPVVEASQPTPAGDPAVTKGNEVLNTPDAGVTDDDNVSFPEGYYRTSPLFYQIADYFGIQQEEYHAASNKLSVIVDWAILKGKSNKTEDILSQIRGLEDAVERPTFGEKRYNKVYAYLRLVSQKDAVTKAMGAYERKKEVGEQSGN